MFVDRHTLAKKVISAVNDCLQGEAAVNYKDSFEAIEGKIPSFINEIADLIELRFKN